eukprot:SAG25_NODE_2159_length_1884_cov_3.732213_2_plen_242_part_00
MARLFLSRNIEDGNGRAGGRWRRGLASRPEGTVRDAYPHLRVQRRSRSSVCHPSELRLLRGRGASPHATPPHARAGRAGRARRGTGASEDHGIDHNKHWLRSTYDSTLWRSHHPRPHPLDSHVEVPCGWHPACPSVRPGTPSSIVSRMPAPAPAPPRATWALSAEMTTATARVPTSPSFSAPPFPPLSCVGDLRATARGCDLRAGAKVYERRWQIQLCRRRVRRRRRRRQARLRDRWRRSR